MQIFYPPESISVLLCFIIWPILQFAASFISKKLPEKFFSPYSFFFKSHKWERNGQIYKKLFSIHKWKKFLPDSGMMIKGSYKKKSLTDFSESGLNRFLTESCRAEMTHLLAILPFWIFGFFMFCEVIYFMLFYALIVNIPCVIAQRYNRPRILNLLNMKKKC